MVKWSKAWERRFNKPNLIEQDWLEPSDQLFENIQNELESSRKNRKSLYWFFLTILLFVTATTSFYILGSDKKKSELSNNDYPIANNISGAHNNQDKAILNLEQSKDEVESSTKANSVSSLTEPLTLKNKNSSVNYSSAQLLQKRNTLFNQDQVINDNNINARPEQVLKIADLKETNGSDNSLDLLNIESIATLGLVPFDKRVYEYSLINTTLPGSLKPLKDISSLSYQVFAGLIRSQHSLNSNYEFALAPADFYAEDRFGYQFGFGLNKQFTDRVGLTVRASYQVQRFTSGHNSKVIYNTALENNDLSQNYDLTLATPLGFVQSDFVLSRSESYTDSATSLDAIFGSSHTIQSIASDVLLDLTVLKQQAWSLGLIGGLSLAYAVDIDNRLVSLDTQHEFIQYSGGSIEKDQSDISRFTPRLLTGIIAKRKTAVGDLVFNMHYVHAGRDFFRQEDFSSQLHGFNIDIGYQFKF